MLHEEDYMSDEFLNVLSDNVVGKSKKRKINSGHLLSKEKVTELMEDKLIKGLDKPVDSKNKYNFHSSIFLFIRGYKLFEKFGFDASKDKLRVGIILLNKEEGEIVLELVSRISE